MYGALAAGAPSQQQRSSAQSRATSAAAAQSSARRVSSAASFSWRWISALDAPPPALGLLAPGLGLVTAPPSFFLSDFRISVVDE